MNVFQKTHLLTNKKCFKNFLLKLKSQFSERLVVLKEKMSKKNDLSNQEEDFLLVQSKNKSWILMMLEKACFLFLMTMKRNKKDQEIYQSYSLCKNKNHKIQNRLMTSLWKKKRKKLKKFSPKKGWNIWESLKKTITKEVKRKRNLLLNKKIFI